MAKFHIGRGGKPAQCNARKGKCPFGSEEEHYKTREEAQKSIEKKLTGINAVLESAKKQKEKENLIEKEEYNDEKHRQDIVEKMAQYTLQLKNDEIDRNKMSNLMNLLMQYENMPIEHYYWRSVEKEIQDVLNSNYFGQEYTNAAKTFINNILDKEQSWDIDEYDDIDYNDKQIKQIKVRLSSINKFSHAGRFLRNYEEYDDYFPYVHKDLGNGFYYARAWESEPYGILYYAPNDAIPIDDKRFTKQIHGDNINIIEEAGFKGVEKKEIESLLNNGALAKIGTTSEKSRDIAYNELFEDRGAPYVMGNFSKIMGTHANIQAQNTYIQKNYNDIELRNPSDNNKTNTEFFGVGISLTKEKNKEIAEKYKNTEEHKSIKFSIENGNHRKDNIDKEELRKVKNDYKRMEKESPYTKHLLKEYTAGDYVYFAGRSHGVDRKESIITDKELKELNDTIKTISDNSVSNYRTLYRGSRGPSNMSAKDYLDCFETGDVVVSNKMLSTSLDTKVSNQFGIDRKDNSPSVLFVYNSKKGAYVEPISQMRGEKEVVIPIGEKMVVVDKTIDKYGRAVIFFTDKE